MHPTVPTTAVSECPSLELLVDFDLGKLSEAESLSFANHISVCERCENALYDLHGQVTEDSVVAWLKRCLSSPNWDEPASNGRKHLAETVQASYFLQGNAGGFKDLRPPRERGYKGLQSLDKYELIEEIGHGGMGVVYRGRHLALDRIVAIKMISAGRHASPKSIARFTREGKAIARLEHPNVVEIYDFDEQDGIPYFAMELMEGGSLHTKVNGNPLASKVAAEIVRTLARTVDYMHRKGIVHRDLKPANILLDLKGIPKISDFGLAKLLESDSGGPESPNLTESGALLGTVSYMAPEYLFAKSSELGHSIDIYALGAILFELLTGHPPFSAATKAQVLDLVRTKPPVPPSRVCPNVPAWLEEVCLKCLEKTPSLRYATAEALAVDLDRWLVEDQEKPKPTLRRAARIWRKARRPAAIVAACAAPLLLLAMGVGRTDPDKALKRIQADLARGQAVTLIGRTDTPKWHRWLAGETNGKLAQGHDGTTSIQSWETAIIELLSDPGSDRFRMTAQIRHDQSETSGEVGLYFAHATYSLKPNEAQFFIQVAFNAITGDADIRARIPIELKPAKTPRLNAVTLRPHLISPGILRSKFDMSLSPVTGPKFEVIGQDERRWQELDVLVTPDDLTVHWNGETFSATLGELQKRVDIDLREDSPYRKGMLPPTFHPQINLRGSLGVYVRNGAASFRSLKIEPL